MPPSTDRRTQRERRSQPLHDADETVECEGAVLGHWRPPHLASSSSGPELIGMPHDWLVSQVCPPIRRVFLRTGVTTRDTRAAVGVTEVSAKNGLPVTRQVWRRPPSAHPLWAWPRPQEHRFLVVGVKAHRGRAQEASVSTAHSQISVESKRTRRSITSRASSASW